MEIFVLASILSAAYITFLVILEVLRRKFGYSPELTRRLVHIVSGISTLVDFLLLPSPWFLALISISLVGIAASQYFGWLTSVHKVKRRTFGEVFLPVGTLSTWAITQGDAKLFVPSLLIMTFADAAAGIVSDILHAKRKVWQGSAVFFAVAFAILFVYVANPFSAIIVALGVTAVERLSPYGSDNASVPIASAALLLLAL